MDKNIFLCAKRKTGRFLLVSSLLIVLCISAIGIAGCGKQEEHTHAVVIDAAVAPTKTTSGLTEGSHCGVCGEILKEQHEVPATGSVGLTYSVNEDGPTCSVTGIGTCTDKDIVIPNKSPDGYTVTKIGNKAFADSSAISITIPDSVTEIGSRAFYNCTGITEIHIPASVTNIGTQIFYKASNLTTVYYDSPYSDQNNKFLSVANIKKVVFGGKYVPSCILVECTNITDIEILDSVTSIDWWAFGNCSGLTSITISENVRSIGDSAFRNCSGLTSITIPDSVTSMGDCVFKYCRGLTSVTIGNSMTSIGSGAFLNCSSLTSITIPDSVTSIGNSAFGWCSGLTSIVIPDSVTSIGVGAFYKCSGLTSVTIGNGVTSIDNYAFEDCSGLVEIHYNGTMAQWKAIKKVYYWDYSTSDYTVYCTDGNLTRKEA